MICAACQNEKNAAQLRPANDLAAEMYGFAMTEGKFPGICSSCRKKAPSLGKKRAPAGAAVSNKKARLADPPAACEGCQQAFDDERVAFPQPARWRQCWAKFVGASPDFCCGSCWSKLMANGKRLYQRALRAKHATEESNEEKSRTTRHDYDVEAS